MLVLIDGEHYPPVIEAAVSGLAGQGHEIVGAVFLGGTEKILENNSMTVLGMPVIRGADAPSALRQAIDELKPERVVDLSDEPIIGYAERFELASVTLAAGLPYEGADFVLRPPSLERLATKPSLAIIGTGKRVGKTAVSAYASRRLKEMGYRPVVVAMGRGGPPEPEVIRGDEITLDADYLLKLAEVGLHAASDHIEDAMMSRIATVGCRRCGGGLAGQPFMSNVPDGVRIANGMDADLIVFEGSGSAMPPVAADARAVVCGANQPRDYIVGYLGTYRLLVSDLVILTNCEPEAIGEADLEALIALIQRVRPAAPVVRTVFRPRPLGNIDGQAVLLTTTAPAWIGDKLAGYLEDNFGCRVVGVSHHLSNRPALHEDIARQNGRFDVLLTELKAAAVDVVTRIGRDVGKKVIYCDNIPVSIGRPTLDEALADLAETAISRFKT